MSNKVLRTNRARRFRWRCLFGSSAHVLACHFKVTEGPVSEGDFTIALPGLLHARLRLTWRTNRLTRYLAGGSSETSYNGLWHDGHAISLRWRKRLDLPSGPGNWEWRKVWNLRYPEGWCTGHWSTSVVPKEGYSLRTDVVTVTPKFWIPKLHEVILSHQEWEGNTLKGTIEKRFSLIDL